MEKSIQKHCKVCGAEYELCYSCEKKNSWKVHADTEDHFYIFGVLMDYMVRRDAHQAYEALVRRGIDIHDTAGYIPSVQSLFAEIAALAHEGSNALEAEAEPEDADGAPEESDGPWQFD